MKVKNLLAARFCKRYWRKKQGWRRGVAVGCRIRDQEVAGSSLGRALRRKNSGQVSHIYVPLSPSSITGTGLRAVMPDSWEGNCRPGGK